MRKKCIIFGIGNNYFSMKEKIENEFEVVALVDNNYKKIGGVLPPNNIQHTPYDIILITPSNYREIYQQLLEMKIPVSKIKIASLLYRRDKILGMTYYGQHSEDLILGTIFARIGLDHPSYIDLGANHPTASSNTAFLYEQGCRGINIEPNPSLIELFKIARPEDINLNVGVSTKEGTFPFYMFSDDAGTNTFLMHTAKEAEERNKMPVQRIVNLPVTTLKKIINLYSPKGFPDFLDCDIEGMDYDVLNDYDLLSNGPKVICVEVYVTEIEKWDNMLDAKGYFKFCRIGANNIYVKKEYSFALLYKKE